MIRPAIKTLIDQYVADYFTDKSGTQSMKFPDTLNSDESTYLMSQIRSLRALSTSLRANMMWGDENVSSTHPVPVDIVIGHATLEVNLDWQNDSVMVHGIDLPITVAGITDPVTVEQADHDDLNANANIQVGNVDVANGNPVPVSDGGGILTVDGTVAVSAVAGNVTVVQATPANLKSQVSQPTAGDLNCTEASASDIKTAVQLIDNAVDGNYLNVNENIAGTDVAAGAGAVGAQVQRMTLASDDPAVVALQLIDNSVDGNYLNINQNIAGVDVAAGAGAVGAQVQRTTLASDDPAVTALQIIDDSIGTVDSAVPTKRVVIGVRGESTVPTEMADNDVVDPWYDPFGRQVGYGANLANGSIDVSEVSPALTQTFVQAMAALTAVGSTAPVNCSDYHHGTVQLVVAAINTSVTVRIEGSADNTSWFNLSDAIPPSDVTYFANGTYKLSWSNEKYVYVRCTFVSEAGGTDVTVTPTFILGN